MMALYRANVVDSQGLTMLLCHPSYYTVFMIGSRTVDTRHSTHAYVQSVTHDVVLSFYNVMLSPILLHHVYNPPLYHHSYLYPTSYILVH